MATLTTVSSNYGTINGIQKDGYSVFRGIPFAKVPTGALRFAPPQKPESFKEAYDAFTFRSIPMQHFTDPDGLYQKEFYDNPDFHFPISEDCLYLNIWTPAHTASEKLPVAVWIHGGGFEHGFSTELEFDGEAYAKKGVILVPASGRPIGGMKEAVLNNVDGIQYAICSNGAMLMDVPEEKSICETGIPTEKAVEAIAYLEQFPVAVYAHTDKGTFLAEGWEKTGLSEKYPYIRFSEGNVKNLREFLRTSRVNVMKMGAYILTDNLAQKLLEMHCVHFVKNWG